MNFLDLIWLIPLLPLGGAAIMLFAGRWLDPQAPSEVATVPELAGHGGRHGHRAAPLRRIVSLLCPGAVLGSFLLSLGATVQLAGTAARSHEVVLYRWIAGLPFRTLDGGVVSFGADWGFLLDPLSAVMALVVTGIGFVIHVYSVGYMAHDGGYYRFFGYLNLFVFFMLMLVLANNYVLLFVGWEGVGLCSYLLIGFYFHKKSASDAGNKAFIVNRIGDAAFILGMLLIFAVAGTANFTAVREALAGRAPEMVEWGVLSTAALLLFIGATGKSAQLPLYTWLPDAMEGPTPVSALIHAATMVTAGVYMVARSADLFSLAPHAMTIVAVTGALTAIFAASMALTQNDIKRVLAYSTVSQLGYMVLALGVGAYWVAVFHLYTHAFFKALLFLGSGSVIHSLSGEQDMRRMGGLRDKIPITFRTMFIGSLAIAGIPGLAGFFSKDEILWETVISPHGSMVLYGVGLITAGLTAFYMWRLMFMTFYGESRVAPEAAKHIHESPPVMTVPLMVLAAGSVLGGWIGVPHIWSALPEWTRAFPHWLEPMMPEEGLDEAAAHGAALEWALMALSVAVAIGGILVARTMYVKRTGIPDRLQAAYPGLHRLLFNKWYVDELYDFLFVRGLCLGGGRWMAAFDRVIVDGAVNGAGWLTRLTSTLSIWWDTWIIDGAIRAGSTLVRLASFPVRQLQSGQVQSYALFVLIGALLFFGYYATR